MDTSAAFREMALNGKRVKVEMSVKKLRNP